MEKIVVILSTEEAKALLIEFYTSFLVDDRENTKEIIESGDFHHSVPEIHKLTNKEICDIFNKLNLDDQLFDKHPTAYMVMIYNNSDEMSNFVRIRDLEYYSLK